MLQAMPWYIQDLRYPGKDQSWHRPFGEEQRKWESVSMARSSAGLTHLEHAQRPTPTLLKLRGARKKFFCSEQSSFQTLAGIRFHSWKYWFNRLGIEPRETAAFWKDTACNSAAERPYFEKYWSWEDFSLWIINVFAHTVPRKIHINIYQPPPPHHHPAQT